MCRCKLLDALRSVDVAATSRAASRVLMISRCFWLGSQMTWSVFGPITCFLICRAMELPVAGVLIWSANEVSSWTFSSPTYGGTILKLYFPLCDVL